MSQVKSMYMYISNCSLIQISHNYIFDVVTNVIIWANKSHLIHTYMHHQTTMSYSDNGTMYYHLPSTETIHWSSIKTQCCSFDQTSHININGIPTYKNTVLLAINIGRCFCINSYFLVIWNYTLYHKVSMLGCVVLCYVVSMIWFHNELKLFIYPYSTRLIHWHWCNQQITSVTMK